MRCPEIVALTGELLLPFNIFFFFGLFFASGKENYSNSWVSPSDTLLLDPDVAIPSLLHDF